MNKFSYNYVLSSVIIALYMLTSAKAQQDDNNLADKATSSTSLTNAQSPVEVSPDLIAGRPVATDLLNNGYFVHLTRMDLFSKETNLKLYGGAVVPVTLLNLPTIYVPNPSSFRPCIYFTLHTTLSNSFTEFQVEQRSQAVIIPAKFLVDKVVNLSPNDTAVWASEIDLRKIDGCVVFINQETELPAVLNLGGIKIERYKKSLPDAVKSWLKANTGKCLELVDAPKGKEALLDKAILGEHDLTDPRYFDDFLKSHPYVSFGYEKTPKRHGFGPMISYLHTFCEEFAKKFKFGIYQMGGGASPRFVDKYRVEPLIALATHLLTRLEEQLIAQGNDTMVQDFMGIQKPKILRAIANLTNYVSVNSSKESYKKRPYTTDVGLRLVDYPYDFIKIVLADGAFSEIREELEAIYWFWRHLSEPLGVLPVDEHKPLEKLGLIAEEIRTKVTSTRGNFFYIQLINSLSIFSGNPPYTRAETEHYLLGINAFARALPYTGEVPFAAIDSARNVNFKQSLSQKGIKVSSNIWAKGIKDMPRLKSFQNFSDSF